MAQKTSWNAATLTESDINTYLMGEGGAWTSWTPVVVQSNTPALTVTRARYARYGRTIIGYAVVALTASGTSSNAITISVPTAMATNAFVQGDVDLYDTSAGFHYYGLPVRQSSTTLSFLRRVDGAAAGFLGSNGFTAALASGDTIAVAFTYEASS